MYEAFGCTQTLRLWRCWSIACAATLRPHRHACEVVSDKASRLSTQTQSTKYCRWQLQQNKEMHYHLLMMVLAEYSSSYSLFACRMMLATSILTLLNSATFPNHCAARSRLAHNVSCIHLV